MFVVAIRKDTSSSDLEISVPGVPPDSYDVVVFDLGRNGLPPGDTNYAAEEEENITVTNPGEGGGKGYLSEKLFAGFTVPGLDHNTVMLFTLCIAISNLLKQEERKQAVAFKKKASLLEIVFRTQV